MHGFGGCDEERGGLSRPSRNAPTNQNAAREVRFAPNESVCCVQNSPSNTVEAARPVEHRLAPYGRSKRKLSATSEVEPCGIGAPARSVVNVNIKLIYEETLKIFEAIQYRVRTTAEQPCNVIAGYGLYAARARTDLEY
eukprot:1918080-Pleurochrysis_carterae.AAC.2